MLWLILRSYLPSGSLAILPWLMQVVHGSFMPVSYLVGSEISMTGLQIYSRQPITLNSTSPILILDYGIEVAGFPYVQTLSVSGLAAQVELKYTEQFSGLINAYGDGPFLYTDGNMNSFRTELFNISSSSLTENPELFNVTSSGITESFFIQGGQRWQSVTLLSNNSITIADIGFRPSVDILPINNLPGAFHASNETLNNVWDLGGRAVQLACVDPETQPSTWEVSEDGSLIRGQYPGTSALGQEYDSYNMTFSTKIVRGGTGWRVAGGANGGYGAYFVITSNATQLASSDLSLIPQNSLVAGYGFSIINQTILNSAPIQQFRLPMEIFENNWYNISTAISSEGYNITINGAAAAFVSTDSFQPFVNSGWGTPSLTTGTWGFGPWLDHAAYFKNVEVTAQNGTLVYTNSLTTQEALQEYEVGANQAAVCLDGAKRDRSIWIGDYAHTARIIAASSGRYDFLQSMLKFEFDWQFQDGPGFGFVPIQASMGAGIQYKDVYYPSEFGESDYQLFFLLNIGDYLALTSDKATLSQYWNGTKLLMETVITRWLDPYSGILAGDGTAWFTALGTTNATAPTALLAAALKQLINVATVLHDQSTAAAYTSTLSNISSAVNSQLWSPELGAYSVSLPNPSEIGVLATAFTIRAGIANTSQATSSIETLSKLFCLIGYMDNSGTTCSSGTSLSPNTQGFLLESLFLANTKLNVPPDIVIPVIRNLLEVFWPSMVNQDEYYTGASWEYVFADGSPGIGIFTSLCHPWGGAPTYVLTDHVLGVRKEWNNTTNDYEWIFNPAWEIIEGLGLTSVQGRVPLFGGGWIEASWTRTSAMVAFDYNVTVVGTTGVVVHTID